MRDEHKVDLIIKKRIDNYYIKEDEHNNISPEQSIIILDKYTTIKRIDNLKKELDNFFKKK